jgi:hypothetical protein
LRKHGDIMDAIRFDTDEMMLAEGKTWHDILALPAESVEHCTIGRASLSLAISEQRRQDRSQRVQHVSTTPTEFRSEAMHEPQVSLV